MSLTPRKTKSLLQAVKKHPVRTAGIAAGAVLGIALLRKAANTAVKVVTIKAVAGAVTDIAEAVQTGGKRQRVRAKGTRRGAKTRPATRA